MLEPDTSVLLTDALRPPPGHEVDVAVTTTYSLNLTAMLIAPMTFALASMDEATRIDDGDTLQLSDAGSYLTGERGREMEREVVAARRNPRGPDVEVGFK